MEVMVPPSDNLGQVSQPSSPTSLLGGYYFSAPTSPSHLSLFYSNDFNVESSRSSSSIPIESRPIITTNGDSNIDFDFAFDVSQDWGEASVSAEELFDGGVIKPLTLPPLPPPAQRGRERSENLPKSSSRRAARSLSPMRDDHHRRHDRYPWWLEEEASAAEHIPARSEIGSSTTTSSSANVKGSSSSSSSRKWRLRDFFLFRSASEGRAAEKDPLKKYTAAYKHANVGDGSGRKKGVSAHEQHYKANRAVSEDMKKKTFLPYKQGILGRLAVNPAVHALANGFGFSKRK